MMLIINYLKIKEYWDMKFAGIKNPAFRIVAD